MADLGLDREGESTASLKIEELESVINHNFYLKKSTKNGEKNYKIFSFFFASELSEICG